MAELEVPVCSECGSDRGPLRNGLCHACDERRRRREARVARGEPAEWVPYEERTHCANNHPWNEENTRINKNGHRECRVCGRLSQRKTHRRGVSEEDYERQLRFQGGKCAICFRPPLPGQSNALVPQLAVDHSHTTGEIRGLLCPPCNRGIGKFDDDPVRLRRAAAYLECPPWVIL